MNNKDEKQNEQNNPLEGANPTARNFQRTDDESDIDDHDKIENLNKMEQEHKSDDLGSAGKEEKDITV
jgi:hypothetical protein